MNAETLARALGATRSAGGTWLVRCPAHDDRSPSLAVREGTGGRILLRCHAGCEQRDVIAALFRLDLWGPGAQAGTAPSAPALRREAPDAQQKLEHALSIWRAARPATGTLVHDYLDSRGIPLSAVPERLRFAPRLRHAPTDTYWPAMVALVTDCEDRAVAVHRTYLAHGGAGKAPVSPAKMMLGSVRGGAVRLGPAGPQLLIGEGIETMLAAAELALEATPAWAALSAVGISGLELPPQVVAVTIAADHDANGTGLAAARSAARRWVREGRDVRVVRPARPPGSDFADVLAGGAA